MNWNEYPKKESGTNKATVNEHKYVDVKFGRERTARKSGLYQYDYGQILRVSDLELPEYVTVDFSLTDTRGSTETRVGKTTDGCLEVQIPNELLKNHVSVNTEYYMIYVYIYVSDETSGNTVYKVILQVKTRSKPSDIGTDQEEKKLLDEAVNAVNAAADRAEQAEQNAKASAIEAGKYAASASESATAAEKNKEDALREVGEKKQEAIEAIQQQEETSVGEISNHTDNEIKRIQNQTADSKAGLEQTITNADASKRELDHSIETAGTSKTALDESVELAGTAKTELDTSTQKASEAKTALDESAKTAGEMQETLSATVKQAGALDTSLGEKIETGTQLKTDITVSGEKAVQDIQTAGSEQLGKMQAVAEEFTADREQITTNKENIASLKEDVSNKITKFYASNQGESHLTDSDNGKIEDMVLYGKSEQKQYKGINLFPPNTKRGEYAEVSIPKGSLVFWITDGTPTQGGNFRFFNEDKTESMWFGVDSGATSKRMTLTVDAKYVQNLIIPDFDLSKICLGVGSEPIYEPYTGGQPSPSPDYPQEIKSVVNPIVKVTNEDGLKVQSVTLNNITLNAIPVSSGGNVTIDGQQYIADRVVEKDGIFGIERNIREIHTNTKTMNNSEEYPGWNKVKGISDVVYYSADPVEQVRRLSSQSSFTLFPIIQNNIGTNNVVYYIKNIIGYSQSELIAKAIDVDMYIRLQDAIFEPLPEDIQVKLRTIVANYPVTNISVTSDQLDGYTVFNYPISMANGWNYVKQQLNDNRDYIYDMDLQSAEAYVNSEYAVALTELEV